MTKKKNRRTKNKPVTNNPDSGNASLAQLAQSTDGGKTGRIGAQLRNSFLTGLIIVGPIGITAYMVYSFVNFIDSWVKPYVPEEYNPETYLPFSIPGLGLIFAIFFIMVIGATTANLFGRSLVSYGESLLDRMPVVRNLYRAIKQIFETVLSQSGNSFQKVGLIEYPRKGLFAIVFVSTETKGEIADLHGNNETMLSVFLPTTPNPTSGYLLFLPAKDVNILNMSVEEGAKLVISAGLVVPKQKAKALIEDAKAEQGKLDDAEQVQLSDEEPSPPTEEPKKTTQRETT